MRSSARYRFMSIATRGERRSSEGTLRARLIHTYIPLELEKMNILDLNSKWVKLRV
jgi:hypothetical protein